MTLTWVFALTFSFGLHFWGGQHPEPFAVRPLLVFGLLFGPSLLMGIWLFYFGIQQIDS